VSGLEALKQRGHRKRPFEDKCNLPKKTARRNASLGKSVSGMERGETCVSGRRAEKLRVEGGGCIRRNSLYGLRKKGETRKGRKKKKKKKVCGRNGTGGKKPL